MVKRIKQSGAGRRKARQKNRIRAAMDYGIDVSMLFDNIERKPIERIRRHQIALNTAEKLRKAKQI